MYRRIAAQELAKFLSAISHPERIRIIEELNKQELDVSTIHTRLELPQSAVSRHLGILKAQRIVGERKLGRQVFYQLLSPQLAHWLIGGLEILEEQSHNEVPLSKAFKSARKLWNAE